MFGIMIITYKKLSTRFQKFKLESTWNTWLSVKSSKILKDYEIQEKVSII